LSKLTKDLEDIESKLSELNRQKGIQSFENILKEYRELETNIAQKKTERNNLQTTYELADKKLIALESVITQFSDDIRNRENEVVRIGKDILQKELFVDTDSFFTNLEVYECPHCEHSVSAEKKAEEHSSHKCSLCGTSVITKKTDNEQQKEQIAKLNIERDEITKNIESLMLKRKRNANNHG
jgi:hypothetical protein